MGVNYFTELNAVNVNERIEKKNGLSYLSWAWAWGEIKKRHPDAVYTIYENADGLFYHTDGRTCWVKTGVTVNGIEHIEYLPVMDYRNASISVDKVTSFDVNKAIQRSLTKACARHGLGLYIYAGEDLPEDLLIPEKEKAVLPTMDPDPDAPRYFLCADCLTQIQDTKVGDKVYTVDTIVDTSLDKFGVPLCIECAKKRKKEEKA